MRIDINGGQKILLRLRPAHAPDTFFEDEDVVHTMLHEVRTLMYSHYCLGYPLTSLRSSHITYMDHMTRSSTSSLQG